MNSDEKWIDPSSNITYQKEYREKIRQKVFQIMGNQCQHCGIKDPRVLVIDHIRPVGKGRRMTISIYFEIIHHPGRAKEKYQLLCHNCNWLKRIDNNESAPVNASFAYHWEIDALTERVLLLEHKFRVKNSAYTNSNEDKKNDYKNTEQTETEIENIIASNAKALLNEKGRLDVSKLRLYLRENQHLSVTIWKAYNLKRNVENRFPKLFEQ